KDALGERRLAGIDVRGDADVARALERKRAIGRIRIRVHSRFFSSRGSHGGLESEMRKRAVRLRHFVSVVALLDCVALSGRRVSEFRRERVLHRYVFAILRKTDTPAHCECDLAARRDLHRDLISRTADATRVRFEAWLYVIERLVQRLERIDNIAAFAGFFDRGIYNT